MRKYVYIGIGGFFGAILRVWIKGLQIYNYHENVPINTLFINISGCFILALVLTIALEITGFSSNLRLGIATGLLGTYTTFSTLCKETVGLIHQGYYFSAISYITVSTMLGLAATYLGIVVAREVIVSRIKERKNQSSLEDLESEAE